MKATLKNQITLKVLAVGFSLLTTLHASASWTDGGLNVIKFDSSNPGRILFKSQVRSVEFSYDYSTFKNNEAKDNSFSNSKPSGWIPGNYNNYYNTEKMRHSWIGDPGASVYSNNNSSTAPVKCAANRSDCPDGSLSVSKSTCRTTKITAGATSVPLANFITVDIAYEKGWQTCNGETSGVICTPPKNVSWDSYTYGTIETQSKWAKVRLTPNDGEVGTNSLTARERDSWKNSCWSVGGTFSYITDLGDDIPLYDVKCKNITNKVTVDHYARYPSILTPMISTCRVTK